jgi:hypothetical protein
MDIYYLIKKFNIVSFHFLNIKNILLNKLKVLFLLSACGYYQIKQKKKNKKILIFIITAAAAAAAAAN